jgi:hypothetical protein
MINCGERFTSALAKKKQLSLNLSGKQYANAISVAANSVGRQCKSW